MKLRCVSTRLPSAIRMRNEADNKGETHQSSGRSHSTTSSDVQGLANLWPGGRVNYLFDADYDTDEKMHLLNAMVHIEHKTDFQIQFTAVEEELADTGGYMHIKFGDIDEATLGYSEDEPTILTLTMEALDDKVGIVMHELLHALGIRHEHNRPDRDAYVKIRWDNIKEDEIHNFIKVDKDVYETFGVPYNYYSVMHYSNYAFSKDERKPTIIFKDKNVVKALIGQRCFLTMEDLELLRKKYTLEVPYMKQKLFDVMSVY